MQILQNSILGGPIQMKHHLALTHKDVAECQKNPDDVKEFFIYSYGIEEKELRRSIRMKNLSALRGNSSKIKIADSCGSREPNEEL